MFFEFCETFVSVGVLFLFCSLRWLNILRLFFDFCCHKIFGRDPIDENHDRPMKNHDQQTTTKIKQLLFSLFLISKQATN